MVKRKTHTDGRRRAADRRGRAPSRAPATRWAAPTARPRALTPETLRSDGWPQRANNAGGTERDRKMAERRQKDELVGKILAHYQARGQDPPIGLPASGVETPKFHLAHVKKEAAAKGSTARPPQMAA